MPLDEAFMTLTVVAQRWRFFNGLRFRARWRPAAPGQADVGVLARETPRAGGVSCNRTMLQQGLPNALESLHTIYK